MSVWRGQHQILRPAKGSEGLGPKKRIINANYVLAVLLNSEFHFGLWKSHPPPTPNQVVPEFFVHLYIKIYKRQKYRSHIFFNLLILVSECHGSLFLGD
jgi:hypothetical protein